MTYNKNTKQLEGEVEMLEIGTASKTVENIIWGDSELNPNNK